ncbi:MAG: hypothetical protein JNM68_16795 [Dinghuibacter sp.]|nr:hypothetical protein [Dinghuibacter sp.]
MHHTPEQKKTLQTTWMASVAIAFIFGILWFWKEKNQGFQLFTPLKFSRLLPYAYLILGYLAWSWDWLVNKDYRKAGIMLVATAGFWFLREYVLVKTIDHVSFSWWDMVKQQFLFSPILWLSVVRACIVFNRKQSVAAVLAGLTLLLVQQTFSQGKFGIVSLTAPFLAIIEYIFRNGWLADLSRFIMGEFLQNLMFVMLAAVQLVLVQWTLQLFTNLNSETESENTKSIFGKNFPAVSGRYYAVMYPVFFIFTVCCFSSVVINFFYIIKGPKGVDFDFPGSYALSHFFAGENKVMPFILLPVYSFFTVKLFQLLHTLVLGRCITLHKKFGLGYLFSFVPLLNLVPWLMYSLAHTPTDEHARLQYATEMNDPNQQRSTGTINLLLVLAILNFIFGLLSGTSGLGGFIGILIMLVSLSMYIGFVYRPSMIYGVITIKVLVFLMLSFANNLNTTFNLVLSIYTVYSILMLFWQKRIFFPDIIMPVDMQLDGEAEINTVKDPGNL